MQLNDLLAVLAAIDAYNALDPNREIDSLGNLRPKELIYGERMSARLAQLNPAASSELQIAVRGQHIGRWKIPRSDYPMDKAGYKRWRTELAKSHGETLADLMQAHNFAPDSRDRVKDLVLKRSLKRDDEAQCLEDVACLVFLEFYFDDFASKHSDEKIIDILQKTWNKMSSQGHSQALSIAYSDTASALIGRALN